MVQQRIAILWPQRISLLILLVFSGGVVSQAEPRSKLPTVKLEVTVKEVEDGKASQGFFLFELMCGEGRCWLTKLFLTPCDKTWTGRPGFRTVVERLSTDERNLQVLALERALEVRYDDIGRGQTVLRFGFRPNPPDWTGSLTSFSGRWVKNSTLLNKVISGEYVPLTGKFTEAHLDCPLLLPGVEENK